MTEFKAPPLPQAPAFNPGATAPAQPSVSPVQPQQPVAQPEPQPAQQSAGLYDNNFAADFNLPPSVLTTKMFVVILSLVCVVGMVLGASLFGSSAAPQQQSSGFVGVVHNTDLTRDLPRCGMTDRGQACILYIVNHTRYDKKAREFFDEAVRLTEVQKYSISIANPKYAEIRIPPGHFAQIQIPNVR